MNNAASKPRLFITGGTGYIGGSFLHLMLNRGYLDRFEIAVLVRKRTDAQRLQALGVTPVLGTLDDSELLRAEAMHAVAVLNTASCDHVPSARALARGLADRAALAGERPILIHTSGAGVLSDPSSGTGVAPDQDGAPVWDEADWALHAAIPPRAPHRLVDLEVFAAAKTGQVRTYLVVPPTVFGTGLGEFANARPSIQIPRLMHQALMHGRSPMVGEGLNQWANVHVADLAELYLVLLEAALNDTAPEGLQGLYYPVTEHFEWRVVSERIGEVLFARGLIETPAPVTGLQRGWFWGSNVRLVATNSLALGWNPIHGGTEAMLAGIPAELDVLLALVRR